MDMRRTAVIVLWWSLVAVSCAGTPSPGKRPASFPLPDSKKDCTSCHVTEGTKTGTLLKKKLSDLCLDCHPDRVAPAEHQVDIAPSFPVKKLPLTDGKMTCVTCHDPHKNTFGSLLRMGQTELCMTCHPY